VLIPLGVESRLAPTAQLWCNGIATAGDAIKSSQIKNLRFRGPFPPEAANHNSAIGRTDM